MTDQGTQLHDHGGSSVLVGSSGCGKTTLLRMVNRMVDPTRGQVSIDGTDIANRNPVQLRRSIGYVMQHAGLLPYRKIWPILHPKSADFSGDFRCFSGQILGMERD